MVAYENLKKAFYILTAIFIIIKIITIISTAALGSQFAGDKMLGGFVLFVIGYLIFKLVAVIIGAIFAYKGKAWGFELVGVILALELYDTVSAAIEGEVKMYALGYIIMVLAAVLVGISFYVSQKIRKDKKEGKTGDEKEQGEESLNDRGLPSESEILRNNEGYKETQEEDQTGEIRYN